MVLPFLAGCGPLSALQSAPITFALVDVQHLNDSFLITRGEADHGASGGAVLTRAGELVGLIWC